MWAAPSGGSRSGSSESENAVPSISIFNGYELGHLLEWPARRDDGRVETPGPSGSAFFFVFRKEQGLDQSRSFLEGTLYPVLLSCLLKREGDLSSVRLSGQ